MSYRLRPRAENDIFDIMSYIGRSNPGAALKWQADLYQTFAMLADLPKAGVARRTAKQGFRIFPKGNYLVVYQTEDIDVDIIRILHAARDLQKQFE